MSVTLTTHSVADGLLTIDASVASPTNYKILRYWIMCSNGHYADECMPTYERWSGGQLTMTTARRLSLIDLSLFPNGPLEFVLNCQHKSLLNSTVVTDETVTISVNNTWNVASKSSSVYSYPEGAIQSPVTLTFDATSTIGIFGIPIALSAVDNVAVSAYLVSENGTTPAAADPRWAPAAPTSYTVAQSGNYTLYAWAKDGDGNISDRVSTTATVYVPTATATPTPGNYSAAQTVTLARANFTGGSIYYTLDGSDPTTASAVYSAPITVTKSTTLKVLPVDADGNQGAVQTLHYDIVTILAYSATPYTTFDNVSKTTTIYYNTVATGVWQEQRKQTAESFGAVKVGAVTATVQAKGTEAIAASVKVSAVASGGQKSQTAAISAAVKESAAIASSQPRQSASTTATVKYAAQVEEGQAKQTQEISAQSGASTATIRFIDPNPPVVDANGVIHYATEEVIYGYAASVEQMQPLQQAVILAGLLCEASTDTAQKPQQQAASAGVLVSGQVVGGQSSQLQEAAARYLAPGEAFIEQGQARQGQTVAAEVGCSGVVDGAQVRQYAKQNGADIFDLFVLLNDPLALRIRASDPLTLNIEAHNPLALRVIAH